MSSPLRLLAPIFLIASGAVFLLDQAGVIGLGWMLMLFWPGLLLCFGVETLAEAPPRARLWGVALMVAGGLLLADNFGGLPLGLQRFWPLALVAVGAALIVERNR